MPNGATVQPHALTVEEQLKFVICVIITVMGKGMGDVASGERRAALGRAFEEGASTHSLRTQGSCTRPTS